MEMIFAELEYECHYSDVHDELVSLLKENFSSIESGRQGDSWIWVFDGENEVAIDTFYSMKHQVKSDIDGQLVQQVLTVLKLASSSTSRNHLVQNHMRANRVMAKLS